MPCKFMSAMNSEVLGLTKSKLEVSKSVEPELLYNEAVVISCASVHAK